MGKQINFYYSSTLPERKFRIPKRKFIPSYGLYILQVPILKYLGIKIMVRLAKNPAILLYQLLSKCKVALLSQSNEVNILQLENWLYLILPATIAKWT